MRGGRSLLILLVLAVGRAEGARLDGPPPEAGSYAAFRVGRDLGLHPRTCPLPFGFGRSVDGS